MKYFEFRIIFLVETLVECEWPTSLQFDCCEMRETIRSPSLEHCVCCAVCCSSYKLFVHKFHTKHYVLYSWTWTAHASQCRKPFKFISVRICELLSFITSEKPVETDAKMDRKLLRVTHTVPWRMCCPNIIDIRRGNIHFHLVTSTPPSEPFKRQYCVV